MQYNTGGVKLLKKKSRIYNVHNLAQQNTELYQWFAGSKAQYYQ